MPLHHNQMGGHPCRSHDAHLLYMALADDVTLAVPLAQVLVALLGGGSVAVAIAGLERDPSTPGYTGEPNTPGTVWICSVEDIALGRFVWPYDARNMLR
jgi:hypothetical protein